jgi:hypothetical protein
MLRGVPGSLFRKDGVIGGHRGQGARVSNSPETTEYRQEREATVPLVDASRDGHDQAGTQNGIASRLADRTARPFPTLQDIGQDHASRLVLARGISATLRSDAPQGGTRHCTIATSGVRAVARLCYPAVSVFHRFQCRFFAAPVGRRK